MYKITEEMHPQHERTCNKDTSSLIENLKYYFHHSTFKSELQKNAIVTILKRKFSLNVSIFIIVVTASFFFIYREI